MMLDLKVVEIDSNKNHLASLIWIREIRVVLIVIHNKWQKIVQCIILKIYAEVQLLWEHKTLS